MTDHPVWRTCDGFRVQVTLRRRKECLIYQLIQNFTSVGKVVPEIGLSFFSWSDNFEKDPFDDGHIYGTTGPTGPIGLTFGLVHYFLSTLHTCTTTRRTPARSDDPF